MPSFWDRLRNRITRTTKKPASPSQPADAVRMAPPVRHRPVRVRARKPRSDGGYPNTYVAGGATEPEELRAEVFEPALKQFPRAFRRGDPAFADAELGDRWSKARAQVVHHLLQLWSRSPSPERLVLRGSLLLQAVLGDVAREPGDIDWVVAPQSIGMKSAEGRQIIGDWVRFASEQPCAGETTIDFRRIAVDDIWTYERAPGRRIAFPWSAPGLPRGVVQMDLVYDEELWLPPVPTAIPSPTGESTSILGVTSELALAWKLLWLESDAYPQGKDLYDATLLAERTRLRLYLLNCIVQRGVGSVRCIRTRLSDIHRAQCLQPDFPLQWDVDWENFKLEYPSVTGNALEWQQRLIRALEPTFNTGGALEIICFNCKSAVTLRWLLEHCRYQELYEPNVFVCDCPSCDSRWEFEIAPDQLIFGYIYAAARAHFAGMEPLRVPGLWARPQEHEVVVHVEGRYWSKPRKPTA